MTVPVFEHVVKRPGAGRRGLNTPQPDASTGPFLADADHYVYAFGWGLDWFDVALQWHQYADRTTVINFDDINGINGRYRKNAWVLAVSVTAIHRP